MLATALGVTAVSIALLPCYFRRPRLLTAPWRMLSTPRPQLAEYTDSVSRAAAALRDGQLVAFPTETVYGLGAHAFDGAACANVFRVKGRPRSDPLIVHVHSALAAEPLLDLQPEGLALLRRLARSFWPGPLTIVAPACARLPREVTAGGGFVGVRCPNHPLALELLAAAALPVAAPSANRFGHVSPTRAEHVMADLGGHALLVLRHAGGGGGGGGGGGSCAVGIESTVLKLSEATRELVLLRRGGVPEAELARWAAADCGGFAFAVRVAHAAHAADGEGAPLAAPGTLLTHYAPDAPSFLFAADGAAGAGGAPLAAVAEAVVVDFGGQLAALRERAFDYQDLSPEADAAKASAALFAALRWAEQRAAEGGRCVLLAEPHDGAGGATVEYLPALADRLFRAASGKRASVVGGQLVEVAA